MPRQMYSKFMFLLFIRYVRNRIDHWCTVKPGNPNPRVHRSSGKLGEASFPTGTVDPRVGISLSPLNTNDGFSLSIPGAGEEKLDVQTHFPAFVTYAPVICIHGPHLRGWAGIMTFHFSKPWYKPALWGPADGNNPALSPTLQNRKSHRGKGPNVKAPAVRGQSKSNCPAP